MEKETNCLECDKELTKSQMRYCSRSCLMKYNRRNKTIANKRSPDNYNGKYCKTCNTKLINIQRDYCSNKCKYEHRPTEINKMSHKKAKDRAVKRKLDLIKLGGGACKSCGYNKNIASLTFHHINENDKKLNLSMYNLRAYSLDTIMEEFNKCELLCHNCHHELHHPHLDLELITNT
jgi:hypothetical protein